MGISRDAPEQPEHRHGAEQCCEQVRLAGHPAGEVAEELPGRRRGPHARRPRRAGGPQLIEQGRQPRNEEDPGTEETDDHPHRPPALRRAAPQPAPHGHQPDGAEQECAPVLGPQQRAGGHRQRRDPPPGAPARPQIIGEQPHDEHLEGDEGVHPVLGGVAQGEGIHRQHRHRHPTRHRTAEASPRDPRQRQGRHRQHARQRPQGCVRRADQSAPVVQQQVVQRRVTVATQRLEQLAGGQLGQVGGEGLVQPQGGGGHEPQRHPQHEPHPHEDGELGPDSLGSGTATQVTRGVVHGRSVVAPPPPTVVPPRPPAA
jgi:hypothetical protein